MVEKTYFMDDFREDLLPRHPGNNRANAVVSNKDQKVKHINEDKIDAQNKMEKYVKYLRSTDDPEKNAEADHIEFLSDVRDSLI